MGGGRLYAWLRIRHGQARGHGLRLGERCGNEKRGGARKIERCEASQQLIELRETANGIFVLRKFCEIRAAGRIRHRFGGTRTCVRAGRARGR